jgi:hypothetical protein
MCYFEVKKLENFACVSNKILCFCCLQNNIEILKPKTNQGRNHLNTVRRWGFIYRREFLDRWIITEVVLLKDDFRVRQTKSVSIMKESYSLKPNPQPRSIIQIPQISPTFQIYFLGIGGIGCNRNDMIIDDYIVRWQRNSTRIPSACIFPIARDETVNNISNIHNYVGGGRTQAGSGVERIFTFSVIIGGCRWTNGHRY